MDTNEPEWGPERLTREHPFFLPLPLSTIARCRRQRPPVAPASFRDTNGTSRSPSHGVVGSNNGVPRREKSQRDLRERAPPNLGTTSSRSKGATHHRQVKVGLAERALPTSGRTSSTSPCSKRVARCGELPWGLPNICGSVSGVPFCLGRPKTSAGSGPRRNPPGFYSLRHHCSGDLHDFKDGPGANEGRLCESTRSFPGKSCRPTPAAYRDTPPPLGDTPLSLRTNPPSLPVTTPLLGAPTPTLRGYTAAYRDTPVGILEFRPERRLLPSGLGLRRQTFPITRQ